MPCMSLGSGTVDVQPDRIFPPAGAQAMQDQREAAARIVTGCDPRVVQNAHDGAGSPRYIRAPALHFDARGRMPATNPRHARGDWRGST